MTPVQESWWLLSKGEALSVVDLESSAGRTLYLKFSSGWRVAGELRSPGNSSPSRRLVVLFTTSLLLSDGFTFSAQIDVASVSDRPLVSTYGSLELGSALSHLAVPFLDEPVIDF